MWCRTITSHCRNTIMNSHVEKLICSGDTRQNTRRDNHTQRVHNEDTVDHTVGSKSRSRSRSPFPPLSSSTLPSSSTSIPSDQYNTSETFTQHTVFRQSFKYYKKRDPRPDMSKVIEPRLLDGKPVNIQGEPISDSARSLLYLRPPSEWKVVTFPDRVGLYILPDLLSQCGHLEWIRRSIQYAVEPNKTNIALHSDKPFSLMDDYRSLRWTTMGIQYDWTTKEYPETGPSLPEELSLFASTISSVLGLGTIRPDAAIVNYYPQKSTLSAHVDRSERVHNIPLISLSVGRPAIYLTGGTSLDDDVIPILLQSGDVLVMNGDQRLVYHAVPAILPPNERLGPLEEKNKDKDKGDEWNKRLIEYSRMCRVNFTIRQVNP